MRTRTRSMIALLAVAALALAACGGGDEAGTDDGGGADENALTVVAGDLFFSHDGTSTEDGDLTISASAGEVTVTVDNQGSTLHNFVVEEEGDTKVAEAEGGATDTGSIELSAGTYTFYCDVTGHRDAGMEGTLEVG